MSLRRKAKRGRKGDTPGCRLVAKRTGGASYTDRNYTLRSMGFPEYVEYLKSDLWQRIRIEVFRKKGNACCLCGSRADQVHHQRYDPKTLAGKLKHLHPICHPCHKLVENGPDGKLSLIESQRKFEMLKRSFEDS